MAAAFIIKKLNFIASQGKEDLPIFETVSISTPDEIVKFKAEALRIWGNGTRIYQQAAAYTLMLNTGLRTGEALGPLNSDIDLENQVIHLQRGAKEIARREGGESTNGQDNPLISDEDGGHTRPVNFRKRYYHILEAANLKQRRLHTLRRTFATNLVDGIRQPDGTIRVLSPGRSLTSSAALPRRSQNSTT